MFPHRGGQVKIFLSYSLKDYEIARSLADALKKSGVEVWTEDEIYPGDNWSKLRGEALEDSNAMIVLISPTSVGLPHFRHDIEFALGEQQYSHRLIPITVGNEIDMNNDEVPWILRKFPSLHLANFEDTEAVAGEINELLSAATS